MTYLNISDGELRDLRREIYIEKEINGLSYVQIGAIYNIPASEVKQIYAQISSLNTDGDCGWMDGLSNRAINQLKKTKYNDFNSLYFDVIIKDVDLEDLRWIGRKVHREIRAWCRARERERG